MATKTYSLDSQEVRQCPTVWQQGRDDRANALFRWEIMFLGWRVNASRLGHIRQYCSVEYVWSVSLVSLSERHKLQLIQAVTLTIETKSKREGERFESMSKQAGKKLSQECPLMW